VNVATRTLPGRFAAHSLAGFLLLLCLQPAFGQDKPPVETKLDPTKELKVPAIFEKDGPESVKDLQEMQAHTRKVLDKVLPCTVGVRVGGASGSGVIIDKEGHVLTAGHVSGKAGQAVTLILPDGKMLKGETLGANRTIDSGMIKITDKYEGPYLEMGKSADLKKGQWVICAGHPGGFKTGRTPPVRLGRVILANNNVIRTDCTLVGGDSGGPLFDMTGKVIGIHSRIGNGITDNMHVPVDTYRDTFDRLAKAEVWGGGIGGPDPNVPYLGIRQTGGEKDGCKIEEVTPDSPAAKAGLKVGDVILKFGSIELKKYDDLQPAIRAKKVGDEVELEVKRGEETLKLKLKLGKRPE